MTGTMNGRPQRKQLSDQLDRLDTMIDCLSEALPQAVADATREGSRQAVREVLAELFGNPETLARFRQTLGVPNAMPQSEVIPTTTTSTPTAAKPGFFASMKSAVRNASAAVVAKVKQAVAGVKERVQTAKARVTTAIQGVKAIVPLGRFAAVAMVVGIVVASVSYVAPQGFSAVVSGVGAVVITGAVQTYRWLRRSARSVGLLA